MKKFDLSPAALIYPLPAVMVSCGNNPDNYNIITIAWTGTICSDPPMCYVSIRPSRHSHVLIKESGEFVINLTTVNLAEATDFCGIRSGKNHNKFNELGLTAAPGKMVKAPIIVESPVNIECQVTEIKELGVHHMFIAKVVHIQASDTYQDKTTGKFDLALANPMTYVQGNYYQIGEKIGKYGYSK